MEGARRGYRIHNTRRRLRYRRQAGSGGVAADQSRRRLLAVPAPRIARRACALFGAARRCQWRGCVCARYPVLLPTPERLLLYPPCRRGPPSYSRLGRAFQTRNGNFDTGRDPLFVIESFITKVFLFFVVLYKINRWSYVVVQIFIVANQINFVGTFYSHIRESNIVLRSKKFMKLMIIYVIIRINYDSNPLLSVHMLNLMTQPIERPALA